MDAINKVNESRIRGEVRRCVTAGDLEGLGHVIETLERQKRDYFTQQHQEVALLRETEQAQETNRTTLAYQDPDEARRMHSEREFDIRHYAK